MSENPDRIVHASRLSPEGCRIEVVRYDRQGRWYLEWDQPSPQRTRLKTLGEAVSQAVAIEGEGGTIHLGQPGGKHFDYGVSGARQRVARNR